MRIFTKYLKWFRPNEMEQLAEELSRLDPKNFVDRFSAVDRVYCYIGLFDRDSIRFYDGDKQKPLILQLTKLLSEYEVDVSRIGTSSISITYDAVLLHIRTQRNETMLKKLEEMIHFYTKPDVPKSFQSIYTKYSDTFANINRSCRAIRKEKDILSDVSHQKIAQIVHLFWEEFQSLKEMTHQLAVTLYVSPSEQLNNLLDMELEVTKKNQTIWSETFSKTS